MIQKLVKIFRVKNIFQLLIVFTVFGITGTLSVVIGKFILDELLEIDIPNSGLYWFLRIVFIFPVYQVLLIVVGTLFGQFRYFWEIEKKILVRMRLIKSSGS